MLTPMQKMPCTEAQALIDLVVDGSLTPTRSEQLQAHLRDCPTCATELAELTRLREVLAAQRHDAPPAGLLQSLWPTLAVAAHAAAEKKASAPTVASDPLVLVTAAHPATAAEPAIAAAAAAVPAAARPAADSKSAARPSRPFRRSSAMSAAAAASRPTPTAATAASTATATTAGASAKPKSAAKVIHPRWRKPALIALVAVLLVVVSYLVGTQPRLMQMVAMNSYSPAPAPLSAPPADVHWPGYANKLNREPGATSPTATPSAAPAQPSSVDHSKNTHENPTQSEITPGKKLLTQKDTPTNSGQTTTPPGITPPALEPHTAWTTPGSDLPGTRERNEGQIDTKSPADDPALEDKREALTRPQPGILDTKSADRQDPVGAQANGQSAAASQLTGPGSKEASHLQAELTSTASTPAAAPAPALPNSTADEFKLDPAKMQDDAHRRIQNGQSAADSTLPDAADTDKREGWGVRPEEFSPEVDPTPPQKAPPGSDPTLPTGAHRDPFAPPEIIKENRTERDPATQLMKPKVIKDGDICVEAPSYAKASQAAFDAVIRHDGWLADNRVVDLAGGMKRGEMIFRCLPEKYEALYNDLKKIGKVVSEKSTAQDITAQYIDMEARLKNLKIAEARLQDMVQSQSYVNRMADLVAAQQKLEKTRTDIETMEGQMRLWRNLVAYSTIHLTIAEPTVPLPAGNLAVEVLSLAGAKDAIDAALANAGGKLLSGQSTKRADGTLQGNIEVQVPLGQFGRFLAAVKSLGRVTSEQIQNQPFDNATPENVAQVPCSLSLSLFEKAGQLPGGSVRIEVQSLPEAVKKLDGILSGLHATVPTNQTVRTNNLTGAAQLQISIRAGSFSALINGLKVLGTVVDQNVSGDVGEITGGTADLPATLQLNLVEAGKTATATPTGSLGIEVADYDATHDALKGLVETFKIQVDEAKSNQVGKQTYAAYTLSIPADRIDAAVRAIEKLGTVKNRQLSGIGLSDLTHPDAGVMGKVVLTIEEKPETVKPTPTGTLGIEVSKYADAQKDLAGIFKDFQVEVEEANSSRINQQTVALFKLAVPAAKVDAVVAALEKLGEVNRRELQGVGLSALAGYDSDAKGHLTVTIQEKAPTAEVKSDLAQSWADATGGFSHSFGAILRGFGVILPWLALLLGILFFGRRFFRKAPAELAAIPADSPSAPTAPTALPTSLAAAAAPAKVDPSAGPATPSAPSDAGGPPATT